LTQPRLSLYGDAKAYSEGRAYRKPTDGSNHPSVTTILKASDKSGLVQWAVDQAVDWCVQNWMVLGERSDGDAKRIARFQHNKVRNDRAEVGDGVHGWIEADHTGTWDYPELDDEQQAIIGQWQQLKAEHDIEPVLTEFTTFISSRGGLTCMGTADGYWVIDGVKTLVDVKTSRNTQREHFAQLAALRHGIEWYEQINEIPPEITDVPAKKLVAFLNEYWEPRTMPTIDASALVHLRADSHEIVWMNEEDESAYWDTFQAYMSIWYATEEIKSNEKRRKELDKEEW